MKGLKKKQLGHWCDYCEPKTTRAVFRSAGFSKFACTTHKPELEAYEQQEAERESHLTEADYQTWMKL